MKKLIPPLFFLYLLVIACQKSVSVETFDNSIEEADSSIVSIGDTITYEVITMDTSGWYGIWNDENGNVAGTGLDSVTWGSAIYFPSRWKYSFLAKQQPLQLMMSVASRNYRDDITINFYRNGEIIKTATNTGMKGVAKILYNAIDETPAGTAQDPVLTYEVILSEMDSSKHQYDGWNGQWLTATGSYNTGENPLTTLFAIPSGWKYSFKLAQLPFTMHMQAGPYSTNSSTVTINFYVNGVLVKTASSDEWIPDVSYDVM